MPSSARGLHLNTDTVHRLIRFVEDAAGRLRRHIDNQTPLAVPGFKCLDNVAMRRKSLAVGRDIDDWRLDLVENKYRRPSMMMNRFLIIWLKRNLQHPKPVVFENDFVMFRCRSDGV